MPVGQLQNRAEVRHGHHVVAHMPRVGTGKRGAKVQGDLVAEEVEIDPGVGASAFLASQHAAVKMAGGIQIGDVKGKVKKTAHAAKDSSQRTASAGHRSLGEIHKSAAASSVVPLCL